MKIEVDGVTYLPAVDISELSVSTIGWDMHDGPSGEQKYIKLSDLESIVPTKTCDCEAKARKLDLYEQNATYWKARWKKTEEQRGEIAAELSTLREQGKCELGEPLEKGYNLPPRTLVWKYDPHTDELWPMLWGMRVVIPESGVHYLDPRPLPALPEQEEPKTIWRVRFKALAGGWITRWHDSERSADDFLHNCKPEAKATKQAYTIEPQEPKQ